MSINLTAAAAKQMQGSISERGKGLGIRLGITTTGCSGFAYVMEFVDDLKDDDEVFEDHGVKIIIDQKSQIYLDGTEINYVKNGLNEGFEFTNPNSKGECGCGESFSV